MISANQYPIGTVIETSKTEDFADFVTGEIESQWENHADHETAKRVTGKEYPEAGEVMMQNFFVKYGDEDIPSYFLGHYARLPDGAEEPEPVDPIPEPVEPEDPEPMPDVSKQQLYGLLTRVENLLTTEDPRAAFSTAESMMQDRDDLLARVVIMRQIIVESD